MPAEITYDQPGIQAAQPATATPWSRLLSPSFSDLFFVFITVWMFMTTADGWNRLLLDADTAFHTRIGQIILSNGAVPHTDPFSFSKVAQPWYAFEWLSETVLALAYNLASWKGIALLAGVSIGLYITLLLKYTVWKGANGLIALVITLLTATGTSIHFHARPHLWTLLFLTVSIWLLEANRRSPSAKVWLLVPITALWANFHGGFFMFFVLLGLRVAGCAAESYFWPEDRAGRWKEALQLTWVGLACAAASLCNPYGYRLHEHIFDTLKMKWIIANVSEFKSPVFDSEQMYDIMILLFAGLASITSLVRKKSLVEPLWILFLAYASLTSVRHATIFMLVAAPIVALELSEWWKSVSAGSSKASLVGMLSDVSGSLSKGLPGTSLLIPVAIIALALTPGLQWPTAFPGRFVPVDFIEKHHDLLASSRLFASDQIADYLIFRSYPKQRVFLDSRHNYYGEDIGNDYIAISSGSPRWKELLAKYNFDLILCEPGEPVSVLIQASGGWHVKDRTDKYILFAKDGNS